MDDFLGFISTLVHFQKVKNEYYSIYKYCGVLEGSRRHWELIMRVCWHLSTGTRSDPALGRFQRDTPHFCKYILPKELTYYLWISLKHTNVFSMHVTYVIDTNRVASRLWLCASSLSSAYKSFWRCEVIYLKIINNKWESDIQDIS